MGEPVGGAQVFPEPAAHGAVLVRGGLRSWQPQVCRARGSRPDRWVSVDCPVVWVGEAGGEVGSVLQKPARPQDACARGLCKGQNGSQLRT